MMEQVQRLHAAPWVNQAALAARRINLRMSRKVAVCAGDNTTAFAHSPSPGSEDPLCKGPGSMCGDRQNQPPPEENGQKVANAADRPEPTLDLPRVGAGGGMARCLLSLDARGRASANAFVRVHANFHPKHMHSPTALSFCSPAGDTQLGHLRAAS